MLFLQTKWMAVSFLLLLLSVLSWVAVAYFVTSFTLIDYEWYQVHPYLLTPFLLSDPSLHLQMWSHLMSNGSFWLGSLLIVVVVTGKDLYICGLQRDLRPDSSQIIQEVSHHRMTPSSHPVDLLPARVKICLSDSSQAESRAEQGSFPGVELQHTREVRDFDQRLCCCGCGSSGLLLGGQTW
jgi:hypothetical protein